MIIFSKRQKIILDTEKFDLIAINLQMDDEDEDEDYPHDNCLICAYGSENYSYIELGEYKTAERAQEVLKQIFVAMTDNLKTFEMPEN